MKKRSVLFTGLILILVIALVIFVSYKEKSKFSVPAIENIKSIKIVPGKAGGGPRDELVFNLNKKEDFDKVKDILNWLKSGKIMGDAKDEFISNGGTPTYLEIDSKDGKTIQIQSAIGSTTTIVPNGIRVDGKRIDGQVTIYLSNKKRPIRELAPELKSFIESGWESFFNYSYQ